MTDARRFAASLAVDVVGYSRLMHTRQAHASADCGADMGGADRDSSRLDGWGSTTKSSVRSGASSRREQSPLPTLAGFEFITEKRSEP